MPIAGISTPNAVNLDRQNSLVVAQFEAYTGGAGVPPAPQPQYVISDGLKSGYWELQENNVAGGGSIIIEGSFDTVIWYTARYYAIVTNGTTATTQTIVAATFAVAQNSNNVLQILDFYPYQRARVTANASSASLSAEFYGLPV